MKLPVIDTYTVPAIIPSTKQTIAIRPYLVREEKLLLIAQESNDLTEQIEAVAQVVRNCTNDALEPTKAPYFDVEYILLQLRSRSVGEIVTPVYQCQNIHTETGEPCGHPTTITINLSDVHVQGLESTSPERFSIDLSDRYRLRLRYPTIFTVNQLLAAVVSKELSPTVRFLTGLTDIFNTLEDRETGDIYPFAEYPQEERVEFLEAMSPKDYQKLIDFLDGMPSLSHTVEYVCAKCSFHHTLTLTGMADFLV